MPRPSLSEFELLRRKELGDTTAVFGLKRLRALGRLLSLQHLTTWLLLASELWLSVAIFGWAQGTLFGIILILLVGRIARLGFIRRLSQRIYRKYELGLISRTKRFRSILKFVAPPLDTTETSSLPDSREELEHLLERASGLVSQDESRTLRNVLTFYNLRIDSVMTPVATMVTVDANETLGPLVLDDLHRTGHTQFPVINVEEVVGLLDISDSVTLRRRESPRVRDVMRHDMARMHGDETLDEVLKVLIAIKQPSLLVINDTDEVVGLASIGDVIRSLTGWDKRGN